MAEHAEAELRAAERAPSHAAGRSASTRPGTCASHCNGRSIGGRKFSRQSQLVSTSPRTRSGRSLTRIWEIAPPVSLATIVTCSSSSASRKSAIRCAMPRGERSAPGASAVRCEPSGQSGTMQRCVGASSGVALAPQAAVDEQAVDEHEHVAIALVAVVDRALIECDARLHVRDLLYRRCIAYMAARNLHTDCMNVNRQAARSASTRAKLIRAARALFARKGYAAVGTEEIVRRAGVTRGALYHQFSGKEDLFLAVYEQVEQELTDASPALLGDVASPFEAMRPGSGRSSRPAARRRCSRIVLIDGPACSDGSAGARSPSATGSA